MIRWIIILLWTTSLHLLAIASAEAQIESGKPRPAGITSSTLTSEEANQLVQYHNKVRKEVGVGPVKWSPTVAKFAQEWANEVAKTGNLGHRPEIGAWKQKYGENMAWGFGGNYGVLTGAKGSACTAGHGTGHRNSRRSGGQRNIKPAYRTHPEGPQIINIICDTRYLRHPRPLHGSRG